MHLIQVQSQTVADGCLTANYIEESAGFVGCSGLTVGRQNSQISQSKICSTSARYFSFKHHQVGLHELVIQNLTRRKISK